MAIEHLILSGGGIKGISLLGVLSYLTEKGMLKIKNLNSIAGSSAGALIGVLLNVGYSPKEIFQECKNIDISSLLDPDVKLIVKYYGVDTGHKLINYIKNMIINKGFNENITFKQLFVKTNIHLILTGTNVNLRMTEYFDYIHSPDLRVLDGMRVSISVPLYFTSPKYEGCHYVDGGILDNFPLHLFDHIPAHKILAIKFKQIRDIVQSTNVEDDCYNPRCIENLDNIEKFYGALLSCVLEELEYLKSTTNHELYHKSTIFIEEREIGWSNININKEEQLHLYRNGIECAKSYTTSNRYRELCMNKLPEKIKSYIENLVNKK